jgi:Transposase, Mutator family
VRKLLYTTDAIESLNYQLRKVTKARGHFPGDDAAVKLLWLAIINIEDKRARKRAARRRGNRQAQRPARTPHRGTTRHGAGAKHSTSSPSPTQDGSGKSGKQPEPKRSLHT